jgi:poly(3-hydroxybutyrate) depolymerase
VPRPLALLLVLVVAVTLFVPPRVAGATRARKGSKSAFRLGKVMTRPMAAQFEMARTMHRLVLTRGQYLTRMRTEEIRTVKRPQDLARIMARGRSPGQLRFVHAHASDPRTRAKIDRTGSIHVGPRARQRLAAGKRIGAILVAHGYTSNADQQRALDDLTRHADDHGLAVVYIDGIEAFDRSVGRKVRSWNAGRCCGPAVQHGFRDVEFIADLLPALSKKFFISGWAMAGESNGGYLAYKTRRIRPDLIRAAFPVVGTEEDMSPPSASPDRLPPVHAVVGARDTLVNPITARLMGTLGPERAAEQAAREKGAERSSVKRVPGTYTRTTWTDANDRTVGSVTRVTALGFDHHFWPGASYTSRRIARLAAQLIAAGD